MRTYIPALLTALLSTQAMAQELAPLPQEMTRDNLKSHIADQGAVVGVMTLKTGDLSVVETQDGKHYYVSGNKRYLFEGRIIDLWRRQEVTTLEQVRLAGRILPSDFGIQDGDLPLMKIGNPNIPRQGYIFVDPTCRFCKQLLTHISANQAKYHFDLILTGVMGPQALQLAQQQWCAEDRNQALKDLIYHTVSTGPRRESCNVQALAQAEVARQLLEVRGVPFLVREDGLPHQGLPGGKPEAIGDALDDWLARQ